MILKWTRESALVLVTLLLVLFALLYYGDRLLLDPTRAAAGTSADILDDQTALLDRFPPLEAALSDLTAEIEDSHAFIPEGESMSEALVTLYEHALQNKVSLDQISRVRDSQSLEGQSSRYRSTGYLIEWSSESAGGFRAFLSDLNTSDRLWNSQELSYQRAAEDSISGSLLLELYHSSDSEPVEPTGEVESAP